MTELRAEDEGTILTWSEVSETHRTRNGIYQTNGELISLLTDFGRLTPCYPDFEGDSPDTIFYTGSGRRGNQKKDVRNQAMIAAVHSARAVPLFCKLGVNRWEFKGFWRVTDSEYVFEEKRERMVWRFVLRKD
ncbi:MAG: hypothetical protein DWQ47_14295 [Acidobacteria bacterium]|nr:MAG: hypothetical protein DWQ32_01695 [Acidobacteriota bacterium]REK02761.1 MAG: hypothetical protein DWQ38_10440 [Acidobacteriota bacterium]REK13434.1 MAG: hypothetical protein DWQ43_07385 [Acidobacteriota bacterium]REK41428.1 MAG: hypothetical protein DWQ47_14295 [Acidobacteriota bacterium]